MKYKLNLLKIFFILAFGGAFGSAGSQTVITGTVKDAASQQPLKFVSVLFKGTRTGSTTDEQGRYRIVSDGNFSELQFSFIGYATVIRTIAANKEQEVNVDLQAATDTSNKVLVKPKKVKYRNKDNPAVELIRHVIENKSKNRSSSYDFVEYEEYDKMLFSVSNMSEKLAQSKLLKNFKFVLENRDTNRLEQGRSILPVYIEESLSRNYLRKSPEKKKKVILAEKKVDFGEYIDRDGISSFLNYMYQDIDIYDNNIMILNTQFLSPIANDAPAFYKYLIMDTIITDSGEKLIKLNYTPRNPADLLFRGTLFISLDGNYAVEKVELTLSKYANVNWVRGMFILQEFEKNTDSRYHISKSEMNVDFSLSKAKNKSGLYGERTVSFKDYIIGKQQPDSIYQGSDVAKLETDATKADSFWADHRHDTLSVSEAKVYSNIDSLKNMSSYKRIVGLGNFFITGYVKVGKLDLGPFATFYAYNPVEGLRLRFGGRTNKYFSKKWTIESYGAYGFLDKRWKYYGGLTYSFTPKTIWEFPVKSLKASFQKEMQFPGQGLAFVQEDNFFLSIRRGTNNKYLYNNTFNLRYLNEFENHFSFTLGYKYWEQSPGGALIFNMIKNFDTAFVNSLKVSEFNSEIRWAPKERFYQGNTGRVPVVTNNPIYTLRLSAGFKGFLGGQYNYQAAILNIQKRVMLSKFGYTDVTAEAGNTFGKLPYPLLSIHRANQSFALQLESYNMMNFLEFVSDRYASINLDHKFNGFFFNKIPLFKKLKWRESFSFKALYGGLRAENNPNFTNDQIKFPLNGQTPLTYTLEQKPYMEISAGVANIFKLLRLDFVKRLNYLDHPDIAKWGIRARFKFDF